jgi:hypothetical protein
MPSGDTGFAGNDRSFFMLRIEAVEDLYRVSVSNFFASCVSRSEVCSFSPSEKSLSIP